MNKLIRITLLGAVLAILFCALPAAAQIDCDTCDPYSNHWSDECYICRRPGQDPGQCGTYISTTCGDDRTMGGNCLQDGCNPYWVETSDVNVGTYGEAEFSYSFGQLTYACDHHKVDLVTVTDSNQCNENSYWWTRSYCTDTVDAWKPWQTWYQDCCDGLSPYPYIHADPTYSCNDYHSCS